MHLQWSNLEVIRAWITNARSSLCRKGRSWYSLSTLGHSLSLTHQAVYVRWSSTPLSLVGIQPIPSTELNPINRTSALSRFSFTLVLPGTCTDTSVGLRGIHPPIDIVLHFLWALYVMFSHFICGAALWSRLDLRCWLAQEHCWASLLIVCLCDLTFELSNPTVAPYLRASSCQLEIRFFWCTFDCWWVLSLALVTSHRNFYLFFLFSFAFQMINYGFLLVMIVILLHFIITSCPKWVVPRWEVYKTSK